MKEAILCLFLFFTYNANAAESVYRIDPTYDASIIGASNLVTLLAYTNSARLIQPRCPCSADEVNSFDRSAIGNESTAMDRTSDITAAAAVAFPIWLSYHDLGFSEQFKEDMTVYFETLSVNGAFVTLTKYSVQRPLPRTYSGDPNLVNNPRGYRSFYSGHTSLVFSALSTSAYTYSLRHGDILWPWILTGVVGTSVAYERVEAGRHFPSDVIVGALAGTAVGIAIPYLHKKSSNNSTVALLPFEDGALVFWKISYR